MHPRDIVAGRFEIDRLAGSGGMGAVYRALDRQTGQAVALKVLHGHGGDHAERFAREARLLSELRHPGIVRFVGSGTTDRGEGFIVMEWLDGESLSDRLERERLPPQEVIALGARVADALRVAHERGIVHRDLKPQNLFLDGRSLERIKVLDFGIARILDPGQKLTITGAMLGTPGYMSPEQVRGEREVDARTDVYALGCVMFRAVTGRRVFSGDDAVSVLLKVTTEPAPRASSLCPGLPPALDALLTRMLAISPADRPRDASALLAELAVIGGYQLGSTALHTPSTARSGAPPPLDTGRPALSAAPAAPSGFAALPPSSFSPGPPPAPLPSQALLAPSAEPRAPAPWVPPQGVAATWTAGGSAVPATVVPAAAAQAAISTYGSSIPGVPLATQPGAGASVPSSRAPLLMLAGAAGALLLMTLLLGGLALFLLAPSSGAAAGICPGERCVAARLKDPGKVDAISVLPQARKLARDIDSAAPLVLITVVTTTGDGLVNVHDTRHVLQFHFQRPTGDARFIVTFLGERMVIYRMAAVANTRPTPEPECSAAAVWRAAFPGGVPGGSVTTSAMQLIDAGPPLGAAWQVSSGTSVAYVDPRTCAARKLF